MSQRLRCLHLSLRALEKVPAGSLLAPPRTAPGQPARRFLPTHYRWAHDTASLPASRRSVHASPASSSAQAQLAPRPALTYPGEEGGRPRPPRRESFEAPARERRDAHNDGHSYSADTRAEVSETLARHLDRLFEPLVFPPDLARRILTHASHRDAVHGHNQRLSFMGEYFVTCIPDCGRRSVPASIHHVRFSTATNSYSPSSVFIGRRALEAYFLLFLHSTPTDGAPADHASIAERALNAYSFGEHVGSRWELGRVIRWTPPDREHAPHREPVPQHAPYAKRGVGLYKVTGTAVEAVVGGVFHQFVRDPASCVVRWAATVLTSWAL